MRKFTKEDLGKNIVGLFQNELFSDTLRPRGDSGNYYFCRPWYVAFSSGEVIKHITILLIDGEPWEEDARDTSKKNLGCSNCVLFSRRGLCKRFEDQITAHNWRSHLVKTGIKAPMPCHLKLKPIKIKQKTRDI